MRHILVHHHDPEEGQAYAAEINAKLQEGYRLKGAGRNYSLFMKGESETESYVLAFDPNRPKGRGYGCDEPPVEGAMAVNGCKELWLYPADRKPEREEVWERVALAERKAFSKRARVGLLNQFLQLCLAAMSIYFCYRQVQFALSFDQAGQAVKEVLSSAPFWLLVLALVIIEGIQVASHIWNLWFCAFHRRRLAEAVEEGLFYGMPEALRGRVYRKNLFITIGDRLCLAMALCALPLLLLLRT